MIKVPEYNYIPLKKPTSITEQVWPEGTLSMVVVGTLTYNHELYIRDCIDGILMQKTTFPVKICVFEDCSTDKTASIIKEYEEKFPSLFEVFYQPVNTWGKPIRQEARKPYNEARSGGKYIALCEGDDYWTDPLKLQKQVDFLEENPEYVLTGHNASIIDDKGNVIQERKNTFLTEDFDFSKEDLKKGKFHLTLTLVYRNIKFTLNDNLRQLGNGDKVLVSMLGNFGKGRYIEDIKPAVYRVHSGGVWSLLSEYSRQKSSKKTAIALKNFYVEDKDVAKYYHNKLASISRKTMRVLSESEDFKSYIQNNLFFLRYNFALSKKQYWKEFIKNNFLYWKFRIIKKS